MENEVMYNTVASIYNLSEFHIGSFTLAQFFSYFSGSASVGFFNNLKVLGGFLAIAFFLMFIINFLKTDKLIRNKINLLKAIMPPKSEEENALGSRWEEIQRHLNSVKEAEWKFAVIEADSLVDQILKAGGYPGDTMGDRLKNIDKVQIVSIDGLWEAHKIRNRLAHDPSYFLRYGEAKRAIQLYEKTLKELGAI